MFTDLGTPYAGPIPDKHENKIAKQTWLIGGLLIVAAVVLTTVIKHLFDSSRGRVAMAPSEMEMSEVKSD